jgi:hypothetical protein
MPLFFTVIAVIAANYAHLAFCFVASSKSKGPNADECVIFRNALHYAAVAIWTVNDVIVFRHSGHGKRDSNTGCQDA